MFTLDALRPDPGSTRRKKRVGRGLGSGHGKTACRGQNGQKSRSGGNIRPGFEGGQMPLYRKLPKRGFKNPFRKVYGVLNVGSLAEVRHEGVVDIAVLKALGLVRKRNQFLKILGDGEIHQPLTVRAHAVSETARNKIETAGGRVEIISDQPRGANIV